METLTQPLLGQRPARAGTPLVGGARIESINWKLHERHHRHKLTLAHMCESEFAAPPFAVGYKRLTRKEFTLEVLRSSYPAGRASLYSVDGVPVTDSHSSCHPLSPSRPAPFSPTAGGASVSRLPSGLLQTGGRRVEQLVGGFVRTRDVRALDPVLSREFGDVLAVGARLPASAASPAQSLILVRCGAIVVRLIHLRAVVVHDGLYIALDSRADGSATGVDVVRAVALRLGASTHEDRLGPEPSALAAVDGAQSDAELSGTLSTSDLLQTAERSERSAPRPARGAAARPRVGGETETAADDPTEPDRSEAPRPTAAEGLASGGSGWGEPVLIGTSTIGARPTAAPAAAAADAARARERSPSGEDAEEARSGDSNEQADESREADLAPFPLRALEALFDVAVDDLRARLLALNDEAARALEALRRGVADSFGGMDDALAFEAVRSLRERVRTLILSVKAAMAAVAETLDDDVQMAFMYLKKVHYAPEQYEQDPNFRTQHEEVELLFESYLNAFSAVQAGLETIEYSIDSSERFVSARLASQRNGLLRLDVTFTVITAAISLGSFVTGLFGMNLGSGVEEFLEPWAFWALSLVLSLLICATTILMMRAPQLVYSARTTFSAQQQSLMAADPLGFARLMAKSSSFRWPLASTGPGSAAMGAAAAAATTAARRGGAGGAAGGNYQADTHGPAGTKRQQLLITDHDD